MVNFVSLFLMHKKRFRQLYFHNLSISPLILFTFKNNKENKYLLKLIAPPIFLLIVLFSRKPSFTNFAYLIT